MDIDWEDLKYFQAAHEAGTFSSAAAVLGVGQATVSRRIASLEESVGHVLFDRLRTGLSLTTAGELLVPYADAMTSGALAVESAMSGFEVAPEGVVRIAAPPGAAVDLCPIVASELRFRFPDVRLEILSDTRAVDLARREADIAVRSVPTTTGDLLVRRLIGADLGLFASPGYLKTLPKRPRLTHLDFIGWSSELAHIAMAQWLETHRTRPYTMTTNSFLVMRAAAVSGLGTVLVPGLQARLAGLIPVKVKCPPMPQLPSYVVVHRASRNVPRIKVVLALLDDAVKAITTGVDIFEPGWWTPAEDLLQR